MRLGDLLDAPAQIPVPNENTTVQLADVRKTFTPDGSLQIFNIENPLNSDFIQTIANFFQVKTTAFTQPIRVLAQEIRVSNETPPSLLKSYRLGFGFAIGDPPPAHTVDRFDHLLSEDAALTAFPRRI